MASGGVSFHSPAASPARLGSTEGFASVWRVGAVPRSQVYCLISAVVGGIEFRPQLGDLHRALLSHSMLVLRGRLWNRLLVVARTAYLV